MPTSSIERPAKIYQNLFFFGSKIYHLAAPQQMCAPFLPPKELNQLKARSKALAAG
jgi:hypothetical protein